MSASHEDPRVEALLREAPLRRARPMRARERGVQSAFAGGLLAAVVAMAVLFPENGASPLTAGLLLAVALVSLRGRFTIGAHAATPVQLAAVPILLLLPPALAVCVLGLASIVTYMPRCVRGRVHPDNVILWIADQWYAAAAALVLALLAPSHPELSAWPIYLAAFATQMVVDTGTAVVRVRLAQGVPPELQLKTSALVVAVDAALAPLGLLAAVA